MRSRQLPAFSGIMLWWCVWIHGTDSTPKVIKATRGKTPNTTVTAGEEVVFVCSGKRSDTGSWYKDDYLKDMAHMYEWNGSCLFHSPQTLPGLKLGSLNCSDHALGITNISKKHEGRWRCLIKQEERALYVHVVASPAETTVKSTSLSTTTTPTSASTSHVTAMAGDLTSTPQATIESASPVIDTSSTVYTTESRTQDSVNHQPPFVSSMTTIVGGTVGGALILLTAVIVVCCLLRSKKEKQNNGSSRGPVSGDHGHQDPEQREDAGMVDNVLYDSYSGAVGQAAKHVDPLVPAGNSQPDNGVADIYAIPNKQRTSTMQEGTAAGDVYSVVQKQPRSEGETMDKDGEMSELYSQVQKPQKNGE